jgi:hypothetical protein
MVTYALTIPKKAKIKKLHTVRVEVDVEATREKPEDAMIEVGKKVAGVGCIVSGSGLLFKGIKEKNAGMAVLGGFLDMVGIILATV